MQDKQIVENHGEDWEYVDPSSGKSSNDDGDGNTNATK